MTIISLTSIPTRFGYLPRIVEKLLEQEGSPTVYVCIPDKYNRFPDMEVVPPIFNNDRVKVLRGKDYGPATKFIAPALVLPDDEKIVYLDDDTDYPPNLVKVLSMFKGGVWGLSGFTFSEYFSKTVSRSHAKEVDVIEGVMLVDCFMFYNELDVLEARLTLLDEYVDLFVLVEAEVTHLGSKKVLYFEENKERFAKWLPKIRYVLAKNMPTDRDPWSREKHQRNCVMEGLEDVPDDAIVMVSDVDEIPDMRKIRYEKLPHAIAAIHMHMFEYSLKYYFTDEPWIGTVVTTRGMLAKHGPNMLRDKRWQLPIYKCAGWHLSSFGDWEHVYKKFSTYAHALDETTAKDPEVYRKNVAEGMWGGKQMPSPPPESIPPLPTELLTRFNHTPT